MHVSNAVNLRRFEWSAQTILWHAGVRAIFNQEDIHLVNTYPYKRISDSVYEISEFGAVSMYLVEGTEKALLIDTGAGVGNLREFVTTLTDKPLEVFITHNHRDHIGNAGLFDHICISDIDRQIGPLIYPVPVRMQFANNMAQALSTQRLWKNEDLTEFTQEDIPAVSPLQDGDIIDLGGRKLQAFLCPGHSPGSMVLLDDLEGRMFCGDICNFNLGLGVRNIPNVIHASMEDTLEAMRRIWAMDFDHDRIHNGHAHRELRPLGTPVPQKVYTQLMELMAQIIDGKCEIHHSYISNVHTSVDNASLGDVSIDFHAEQIHGKHTTRILADATQVCSYW